MADLGYRFVALPRTWPGRARPSGWRPKPSPFKLHNWGRIERELLSELKQLKAKDVTIALDIQSPAYFRQDGGIRADARTETPKVVLAFTRSDTGVRLTFPCDAFAVWQDNIWAIRLTLQYLRAIDRYGVTQGDQQYVGFAALPSGQKAGMSIEDGVELLAALNEVAGSDLLTAPDWLFEVVTKRARALTHPDAGGSNERFQEVEEAIRLVSDARSHA